MKKQVFLMLLVFMISVGTSEGHVPYIEDIDYSETNPFIVENIEQSIALYSWLKTHGSSFSKDVDVAKFEIEGPTRFFGEIIVPVCPAYVDFFPWFLLAGPELPKLNQPLPFSLPEGYGAIIAPNVEPEGEREVFYEPFGGKSYYQGPVLDQIIEAPGIYFVYYWDPYHMGGDYVGVLGYEEIWNPEDIQRGLIYTPYIRQDKELHTDCSN